MRNYREVNRPHGTSIIGVYPKGNQFVVIEEKYDNDKNLIETVGHGRVSRIEAIRRVRRRTGITIIPRKRAELIKDWLDSRG